MKLLKFLAIPLLFVATLYASDNSCSTPTTISQLDGVTQQKTVSIKDYVHETKDPSDYYTFTPNADGKVSITVYGGSVKYGLYVGEGCSRKHMDNSYKSKKSYSYNVKSGETVTIGIRRYYRSWMQYRLDVSFKPSSSGGGGGSSAFKIRYSTNLVGNMRMIGNTVLGYSGDIGDNTNAALKLKYTDVDNDPNTFDSSSATIEDHRGNINLKTGKIVWAGLYWQGYLNNDNDDDGLQNTLGISSKYSTAKNQIPAMIQNQTILLKVNGNSYSIKPKETFKTKYYDSNGYIAYSYAAFADVTQYLKGKSPSAQYTIANLLTRTGKTKSGKYYDGLGNFGAWTLVVVYSNPKDPYEKTRNVTVYDGYSVIKAKGNPKVTLPFEGFKTPQIAPNGVDSAIAIFAGEGDKNILGDYAYITNEVGKKYDLPPAKGTDSYFASAIEDVNTRNPAFSNNNGIDIHTTQIGTSAGKDKPIGVNQHKAYLTVGTTQDTIFLQTVAFSTQLYTPELCYDYNLRIADGPILLKGDKSDFNTTDYGKPLQLKVLIRSKISDFPIKNATIQPFFTPSDPKSKEKVEYIKDSSYVSPPHVNAYLKVPDVNDQGKIALGTLSSDKKSGTIGAMESVYTKQFFKLDKGHFSGKLHIEVEGDVKFDESSNPIHYSLSTSASGARQIKRCETNKVYDPIWGEFNVERHFGFWGWNPPTTPPEVKYPLPTRVVGEPFKLDIVSYGFNPTSGQYDVEFPRRGHVELELIDASLFDNYSKAGYDSSCEEPDRIGKSIFVDFGGPLVAPASRKTIEIPKDFPAFADNRAHRNVAFRVWYIGFFDEANKFNVIENQCMFSGDCFKKMYDESIKVHDTAKYCSSDCGTSYDPKKCYQCLKTYFGKPACSRDNFSIRPASFKIEVSDNMEKVGTGGRKITNNLSAPEASVAAGYKYNNLINALNINGDSSFGYYIDNRPKKTKTDKTDGTGLFLESDNPKTCKDTDSRNLPVIMINGSTYGQSFISNDNNGKYKMFLRDKDWTIVDQGRYKYKTVFGGVKASDCIDNSDKTTPDSKDYFEKVGCDISSINKEMNENKVKLRFRPYALKVEGNFKTLPGDTDHLFMSDLENSKFQANGYPMSALFDGNVTAIAKGGKTLTNFSTSCFVDDVTLSINRDTSPYKEEELVASSENGSNKPIVFQQALEDINGFTISSGVDAKSNLSGMNFSKPGVASFKMYMNFSKPLNAVSSPIKTAFKEIKAIDPDSTSNAEGVGDWKAKGKSTINRAINYYFGKITPYKKLYGPTRIMPQETPIFVDVYCKDDGKVHCADFNLFDHTLGIDENYNNWYTASNVFSNDELGLFNLEPKITSGNGATGKAIWKNSKDSKNIPFDDENAQQKDIEVSADGSLPATVQVFVKPAPWLLYDEVNPDGYPSYKVRFVGESVWSGAGHTGNVIDVKTSASKNKKIRW